MADTSNAPLVLVVDDEPRARKLLRIVLEYAGYRVLEAEDGQAALPLLSATAPDLVVADLMMPGMSGIELLGRIRRDAGGAAPRLVLLTAMDTSDTREAAQAAGIDEIMAKPLDRTDLLRRIDQLLRAKKDR